MNVSIGERWEIFVEQIVKEGRFSSPSEVVREGLRLVEEREAKLKSLHDEIENAIQRGGDNSAERIDTMIHGLVAASKARAG